jgi:DNA (cytosine-5)-methyltransferase 3A
MPLTVLSLFDGISCGQEALARLGYECVYYAAEIKPHAIAVTQDRYPNTIQIGDVRNVTYADGYLHTADGTATYEVPHFDLVLAGSPCQDFSRAGDNKPTGLDGQKSGLYVEFYRLLQETNPTWFLLENVRMGGKLKPHRERITANLAPFGGVMYELNSSDWCAQNRPRLYWTNVPQQDVLTFDSRNVGIRATKHDYPVTVQGLIGPGYERIKHLQQRKKNEWRKKERVANCITACRMFDSHHVVVNGVARQYTCEEFEALQTLPAGYTNAAGAKTNRGNLIGDAWTVVVVADLLRGIKILR